MTRYWRYELNDTFRFGRQYQTLLGIDACDGFQAEQGGPSFTRKKDAERFCKLANKQLA